MGLMDGLSGWLKQIVAVVLLASLVDLLLPNRTMQRYVRLVAGLFVLLTVATPVLKWMQSDFGGKLASELDKASRPTVLAGDQLAKIEKEGRRLRERQSADAADLVASRLAEAIRADIAQSENRAVRNVDVKVETEPDGRLSVRGVTVTLEAADGAEGSTSPSSDEVKPVARVEPVSPVMVDLTPADRDASATVETQTGAGEAEAAPPDRSTQLRISAFVSARYGIPADQVVVTQIGENHN